MKTTVSLIKQFPETSVMVIDKLPPEIGYPEKVVALPYEFPDCVTSPNTLYDAPKSVPVGFKSNEKVSSAGSAGVPLSLQTIFVNPEAVSVHGVTV